MDIKNVSIRFNVYFKNLDGKHSLVDRILCAYKTQQDELKLIE